jgi:hypothetical protein
MAQIIVHGQKNGEIGKEDPYLLAEMLTGSLFNIVLTWLHSEENYSLKERLKLCAKIFLKGVAEDGQAVRIDGETLQYVEKCIKAFEDLRTALSK